MEIDALDAKIINYLQKDGRMPYTQIASDLNLAESTIRTRVNRMIKEEIIQIVAVTDPIRIGFPIVGTTKIYIDPKKVDNVAQELKKIKEICFIAFATGSVDIDTEFYVRSNEELHRLIYEKIGKIDGIVRSETSIFLSYVKNRYDWGTPFDKE